MHSQARTWPSGASGARSGPPGLPARIKLAPTTPNASATEQHGDEEWDEDAPAARPAPAAAGDGRPLATRRDPVTKHNPVPEHNTGVHGSGVAGGPRAPSRPPPGMAAPPSAALRDSDPSLLRHTARDPASQQGGQRRPAQDHPRHPTHPSPPSHDDDQSDDQDHRHDGRPRYTGGGGGGGHGDDDDDDWEEEPPSVTAHQSRSRPQERQWSTPRAAAGPPLHASPRSPAPPDSADWVTPAFPGPKVTVQPEGSGPLDAIIVEALQALEMMVGPLVEAILCEKQGSPEQVDAYLGMRELPVMRRPWPAHHLLMLMTYCPALLDRLPLTLKPLTETLSDDLEYIDSEAAAGQDDVQRVVLLVGKIIKALLSAITSPGSCLKTGTVQAQPAYLRFLNTLLPAYTQFLEGDMKSLLTAAGVKTPAPRSGERRGR